MVSNQGTTIFNGRLSEVNQRQKHHYHKRGYQGGSKEVCNRALTYQPDLAVAG